MTFLVFSICCWLPTIDISSPLKEIVKLEANNIEQLVNLSGVKDENLEVVQCYKLLT